MSRIGKQPVLLSEGVKCAISRDSIVTISGPKGTLSQPVSSAISVSVENNLVLLKRKSDQKSHRALHGLYRALIQNMVVGVSEGYTKVLELVGVGYKASVANNVLELSLGYSHGIFFAPPEGIILSAEMVKGKPPVVRITGVEKQLVGQVAAKLRALRKVEPYKGKGIRFLGEHIRRKPGKSATK